MYHRTFNVEVLAKMFDLKKGKIVSIISLMIYDDSLKARINLSTGIVTCNPNLTAVENAVSNFTDKLNSMVEGNEKLWEAKSQALGADIRKRKETRFR
jgi:hypothetical protein